MFSSQKCCYKRADLTAVFLSVYRVSSTMFYSLQAIIYFHP